MELIFKEEIYDVKSLNLVGTLTIRKNKYLLFLNNDIYQISYNSKQDSIKFNDNTPDFLKNEFKEVLLEIKDTLNLN